MLSLESENTPGTVNDLRAFYQLKRSQNVDWKMAKYVGD